MLWPRWGRHVTREIRVSTQVLSHINRRTTQRRKLRDNFIRVEKRSPGQASFLKEAGRRNWISATRKGGLGVVVWSFREKERNSQIPKVSCKTWVSSANIWKSQKRRRLKKSQQAWITPHNSSSRGGCKVFFCPTYLSVNPVMQIRPNQTK